MKRIESLMRSALKKKKFVGYYRNEAFIFNSKHAALGFFGRDLKEFKQIKNNSQIKRELMFTPENRYKRKNIAPKYHKFRQNASAHKGEFRATIRKTKRGAYYAITKYGHSRSLTPYEKKYFGIKTRHYKKSHKRKSFLKRFFGR